MNLRLRSGRHRWRGSSSMRMEFARRATRWKSSTGADGKVCNRTYGIVSVPFSNSILVRLSVLFASGTTFSRFLASLPHLSHPTELRLTRRRSCLAENHGLELHVGKMFELGFVESLREIRLCRQISTQSVPPGASGKIPRVRRHRSHRATRGARVVNRLPRKRCAANAELERYRMIIENIDA